MNTDFLNGIDANGGLMILGAIIIMITFGNGITNFGLRAMSKHETRQARTFPCLVSAIGILVLFVMFAGFLVTVSHQYGLMTDFERQMWGPVVEKIQNIVGRP